jgi:hypothetical protein
VSAETADCHAAPDIWVDVLDRSERELAAGQTVDGAPLMRRLDGSIARLEAKKAGARRG